MSYKLVLPIILLLSDLQGTLFDFEFLGGDAKRRLLDVGSSASFFKKTPPGLSTLC